MNLIAIILPALLLFGCASTAPEPPAQPIGPRPEAPARPDARPDPPSPLDLDLETSCEAVLDLHRAGDHKPVVDAMRILRDHDIACSPDTEAAFGASREILHAADEQVRAGLGQRDRGDMSAARRSFEQALALYPKYYWVNALEQTLSSNEPDRASALLEQAAQLQSQGRIEEALAIVEQAHSLAPDESKTTEALSELKTAVAFRHLAAASQAHAEGRLEEAVQSVTRAIVARPDVEEARLRVVEAARSLGLSLFSAGELIKARGLWQAALALDETNATLLEYLGEVDARLESLAAIQKTRQD